MVVYHLQLMQTRTTTRRRSTGNHIHDDPLEDTTNHNNRTVDQDSNTGVAHSLCKGGSGHGGGCGHGSSHG